MVLVFVEKTPQEAILIREALGKALRMKEEDLLRSLDAKTNR